VRRQVHALSASGSGSTTRGDAELWRGLAEVAADTAESAGLGGQQAVEKGDAALAGDDAEWALALDGLAGVGGRPPDLEVLGGALAGGGLDEVAVDGGFIAELEAPRQGVLGLPGQEQEVDAHQLVGDRGDVGDEDEVPARGLTGLDRVALQEYPLVLPQRGGG
jgi:hypothetical protein